MRREEQTIDFRCEVTYTGYKAPMLQWRDENGLVLESEYEADDANPNRVVYEKASSLASDSWYPPLTCFTFLGCFTTR